MLLYLSETKSLLEARVTLNPVEPDTVGAPFREKVNYAELQGKLGTGKIRLCAVKLLLSSRQINMTCICRSNLLGRTGICFP